MLRRGTTPQYAWVIIGASGNTRARMRNASSRRSRPHREGLNCACSCVVAPARHCTHNACTDMPEAARSLRPLLHGARCLPCLLGVRLQFGTRALLNMFMRLCTFFVAPHSLLGRHGVRSARCCCTALLLDLPSPPDTLVGQQACHIVLLDATLC